MHAFTSVTSPFFTLFAPRKIHFLPSAYVFTASATWSALFAVGRTSTMSGPGLGACARATDGTLAIAKDVAQAIAARDSELVIGVTSLEGFRDMFRSAIHPAMVRALDHGCSPRSFLISVSYVF